LTRAKQQVRDADFQAAFVTLDKLKTNHPNNAILLNLQKAVYTELGLWQPLIDLLPKLVKTKAMSQEEQVQLTQRAQCGLLQEIAEQKGSEGLIAHWNGLARKTKLDDHLVECFVKQLIARQADNEAFTVIKENLKKHPNSGLYALLPEMKLPDSHPVVVFLEGAIRKDGNNAEAHSALAQIKMRDEKWQEAQQHLEKALSVRSNLSDYAHLADTLEKQDLTKAAHEVSKRALTLVNESA
jgi:HemY protein